MTVTVDQEPLAARELGLRTVGQVLAHLQRDNRLVVQVLIDGSEPNTQEMGVLRGTELEGHCIYIETANPRQLALDVLDECVAQLEQAEQFKSAAADLLQRNLTPKALENLGACLRIWQHARDSVVKTAELLRLDLGVVCAGDQRLEDALQHFSGQLQGIKSALEQRDYVWLSDVLMYEMADTNPQWQQMIGAMRQVIANLH